MKGKRYTTEDKIRILRKADSGQTIGEVIREANISEFVCEKSCEPGTSEGDGKEGRYGEDVPRASGVSVPEVITINVAVSASRGI